MKRISAPADPVRRIDALIRQFIDAPPDADIEGSIGKDEADNPAVIVSINGKHHCLSIQEARVLARIAEDTMNKFPSEGDVGGFPNLILLLRTVADKAEPAHPAPGDRTK